MARSTAVPLASLACQIVCSMMMLLGTCASSSPEQENQFESADGLTKMSRSNNGYSPVWTIEQQPQSCGLVWFNQSAGAMSQYNILGMPGADGCNSEIGESTWAVLFQVEESEIDTELFESLCEGKQELPWLPRHQYTELTSTDAREGMLPPVFNSGATTFMIVRNTCPSPVNVLVSQQVGLEFVVHVSTLLAGYQACVMVLTGLVSALIFALAFISAKVVWTYFCNKAEPDSATSRVERSAPAFAKRIMSKVVQAQDPHDYVYLRGSQDLLLPIPSSPETLKV